MTKLHPDFQQPRKRWSPGAKHAAVGHVRRGAMCRAALMQRHGVSAEEMTEWERDHALGLGAHTRTGDRAQQRRRVRRLCGGPPC